MQFLRQVRRSRCSVNASSAIGADVIFLDTAGSWRRSVEEIRVRSRIPLPPLALRTRAAGAIQTIRRSSSADGFGASKNGGENDQNCPRR